MPLKGIPISLTPELLYLLARMGHGDSLVIADANMPSDTIAASTISRQIVRVSGSTSDIARDVLKLMPLDTYHATPVQVMDRVPSDKEKGLVVPAYKLIEQATENSLEYVERFEFYERAKKAFAVVQTDDFSLYANIILFKGVVTST